MQVIENFLLETLEFYPNFNQNAANFLNSMGSGPIPHKECESSENFNLWEQRRAW